MEKLKMLLVRLCVCCLIYALIEALLPQGRGSKGVSESVGKAAALALTATVFGII